MPIYLKTNVRMSELAKVAMGLIPADCVFQGGKLVNVLTGEIYKTNIAVKGERIAAVGDVNHTIGETTKVYDANGMFITPGLIDGHIHIESSMLTIEEFSRLVVPHGTTSVSADFHEVANVLGLKGLRLFHKISGKVLLRVFLVAPSSVPLAYNIEIPSVHLNLEDIEEIMKWDRVLGLGEILNVHDLISESKELNKKIQLAIKYGKFIDGNAPGIGKKELNAYIASGPQHDHEAVSTDEAKERLRLGMWVMIREGSSERNLADLIEIVNEKIDTRRCCFATDDKSPCDLAIEGHLDHCVRKSIELGVDPVKAIQMATINCAEYMGLERELGSVAPGKLADFIIVDDLKKFNVRRTIIGGRVVAENGKPLFSPEKVIYPKWATNTFRLKRIIKPSDLEIKADCRKNVKVRLIDVTEGTITSKASEATMFVQNNKLVSDIERDILKIVVVERYGKTNIAIGKGFIRGFGLQHGALASSIAHDTHNIICVGTNDADMALAINRVSELQGGLVIFKDRKSVGELMLNLAGIISLASWEKVSKELLELHEVAQKQLGCKLKSPFMVLSFQSSASIPELKISTLGLIDVRGMELVPLFLD